MKKIKEFMGRYSLTVLGAMCAFVVTIANTATTNCTFMWFYEEEIPDCLKD